MLRLMGASVRPERALLAVERDRAERRINGLRVIVLAMLAVAAAAYAPSLPLQLNVVNVAVLTPMLCWTIGQYVVFYGRERIPPWVGVVNPVADVVAVTLTIAGYGLEATPPLALKSPLVLAYFVILAARPISSSVRNAAVVSVLTVLSYATLELLFLAAGGVVITGPLGASVGPGVSLLDEAVKVVLLATGGAVATYASWWNERLALGYSTEAREREALQTRLAASRLDSLKQQLQPHFLFNALNAITALVHTDVRAAERMISGLGELIRVSLDGGGDQEVSLERELVVLGHYTAIQQIRFEDRLTIITEVDDGALTALVPTLILQPLVENAIKHGMAPRAAPVRIEVRAWRCEDGLAMSVSDNGYGLRGMPVESLVERVGIGNARARLMYLYGDHHSFVVESPPRGGFTVRMTIPYRTLDASAGMSAGGRRNVVTGDQRDGNAAAGARA